MAASTLKISLVLMIGLLLHIQLYEVKGEDFLIHTLTGHTWYVYSVAVTPDGSKIVSGSADDRIRIWNIYDGSLIQTLTGHTSSVYSVAVTPDGSKVVSGSGDYTIKIWSISDGNLIRTLTGHTWYVKSVVVTPDGSKVVSGSRDNTIKIWNLNTGNLIRTLTGHTDWVNSVAATPDGSKIVSGSRDYTIKIWNLNTGNLIRTLTGHTDWVYSVAVTPDGSKVVSGSGDYTIKIWSFFDKEYSSTLTGHRSSVYSVAVTPDGSKIVSGSDDETIKIWELCSGGSYDSSSQVCTPCLPGSYSPGASTSCIPCPPGSYNPSTGQSACILCGGSYGNGNYSSTDISSCQCKSTSYLDSDTKLCNDCPRGFVCNGGTSLHPAPGFWQAPSPEGEYLAYECPNQVACKGEGNTCAVGYAGPLCSVCTEGYGKTGLFCMKCPARAGTGFLVFLMVAIPLGFSIFIIEQSRSPRTDNVQLLKTYSTHFQILSYLANFDVNWSSTLISALQIPSLFSFSFSVDSYPMECQFDLVIYWKLFITMLVPLALMLIALLMIGIKTVWGLARKTLQRSELRLRTFRQDFLHSILIMFFFVHPTITSNIAKIFTCKTLGNESYLKEDMSINCSDSKYQAWRDVSMIYIITYCFAGPVLLLGYMVRNRKNLVDEKSSSYNLLRFIVDGYTEKCFYWEMVLMMQKLVVVIISVFFPSSLQIYLGIWLIFLVIAATVYFQPYVSEVLRKAQLQSLMVIYFTLMLSLLFRYSNIDAATEIVLIVSVMLSNGFICVMLMKVAIPLMSEVSCNTFNKVAGLVKHRVVQTRFVHPIVPEG